VKIFTLFWYLFFARENYPMYRMYRRGGGSYMLALDSTGY